MEYIVDRIEEHLVVLELPDRSHQMVELNCFSSEVKEGDVVQKIDGLYIVDQQRTQQRRAEIQELTKHLFD